jgi:hypothetical protein
MQNQPRLPNAATFDGWKSFEIDCDGQIVSPSKLESGKAEGMLRQTFRCGVAAVLQEDGINRTEKGLCWQKLISRSLRSPIKNLLLSRG